MAKKLYVGNLSFETTEQEVRDLLSEYGKIESLAMINDRETGRFRGFCFVEMEDSAANAAINALNGKDVDGRALKVNEARPREERGGPRGGGGGSRGGPRGGSRGGNQGGNRGGGSNWGSGGGNRGGNRGDSRGNKFSDGGDWR